MGVIRKDNAFFVGPMDNLLAGYFSKFPNGISLLKDVKRIHGGNNLLIDLRYLSIKI
jgi:hypothetical protein